MTVAQAQSPSKATVGPATRALLNLPRFYRAWQSCSWFGHSHRLTVVPAGRWPEISALCNVVLYLRLLPAWQRAAFLWASDVRESESFSGTSTRSSPALAGQLGRLAEMVSGSFCLQLLPSFQQGDVLPQQHGSAGSVALAWCSFPFLDINTWLGSPVLYRLGE